MYSVGRPRQPQLLQRLDLVLRAEGAKTTSLLGPRKLRSREGFPKLASWSQPTKGRMATTTSARSPAFEGFRCKCRYTSLEIKGDLVPREGNDSQGNDRGQDERVQIISSSKSLRPTEGSQALPNEPEGQDGGVEDASTSRMLKSLNAQGGKGWSSPLTETSVAETWSSMEVSQSLDELGSSRMDVLEYLLPRLLPKPNIVTYSNLSEDEGNRTVRTAGLPVDVPGMGEAHVLGRGCGVLQGYSHPREENDRIWRSICFAFAISKAHREGCRVRADLATKPPTVEVLYTPGETTPIRERTKDGPRKWLKCGMSKWCQWSNAAGNRLQLGDALEAFKVLASTWKKRLARTGTVTRVGGGGAGCSGRDREDEIDENPKRSHGVSSPTRTGRRPHLTLPPRQFLKSHTVIHPGPHLIQQHQRGAANERVHQGHDALYAGGSAAKESWANSSAGLSPASASAPPHMAQTRSARHARTNSLSSPCRPYQARGPSGTNPPSKPAAIASHTLIFRLRGQALYNPGKTAPIRERSWVVVCVGRRAPKTVSWDIGQRTVYMLEVSTIPGADVPVDVL
ncbi:hypothetical protein BC826DRAFT_1177712 [Russula brevipes]|nr:hypothetical protein BC826DRAFT_1177712 [Russula brevipes]